jgi:hypothetical protein
MGNIYDALIDFGYDDTEEDFETEMDLDRDTPDNPFSNDVDIEEYEDWVESMIGEPEYLGER